MTLPSPVCPMVGHRDCERGFIDGRRQGARQGTGHQDCRHQGGGTGLPFKRVDVDPDSKPHGGVPAPHVLESTRNVNSKTGQTFLAWKKMPSPARPDEFPQ
ncbi:polymorphic toxin type 24 domain-containing protein [Streptomyces flaveolus]|uniref:polymorphic toxin type 24 domain-containing protein n=1 Tax=Streptomyces flaveolus TaxID=67297 RepID=UPI0033C5CA1B